MLKFKKIYLALTAFLACAALSASALAAPETSVESHPAAGPVPETAAITNAPASEAEEPPVIIGDDITEPVFITDVTGLSDTNPDTDDPYPGAVADAVDTVPAEEAISPPYDPSSGELPPERNSDGEMFSGFEKGYGSIDNIKDYWEINGYPEYISFICDQGVASYDVATQTETVYHLWEIGIADISEEKKEEVRSLVSSEQRLFFTDCTYNLREREQIKKEIESVYPLVNAELSRYSESIEVYLDGYDEAEWDKVEAEILAMFDNDSRLILIIKTVPTVGIPEEIGVVTGENYVASDVTEIGAETAVESNIDIISPTGANNADSAAPLDTVPETLTPRTEAAATANGNDYDIGGIPDNIAGGISSTGAPIFEEGIVSNPDVSGAISEIGGVAAMINAESQRNEADSLWIWICAVAAVAVVITAAVLIGKKHAAKNLSLADGGEIAAEGKITKGEIVKAVRESESVPDDKVFGEIMERIRKN